MTVLYEPCSLVIDSGWGGKQDKEMSKGHLPRVVDHPVYNVYYILREAATLKLQGHAIPGFLTSEKLSTFKPYNLN